MTPVLRATFNYYYYYSFTLVIREEKQILLSGANKIHTIYVIPKIDAIWFIYAYNNHTFRVQS